MVPRRRQRLIAVPDYEKAIVRFTTSSGATAGLGVLVGPRAVVTCAHVINAALGRQPHDQARPGSSVKLDVWFPRVGDDVTRKGTVLAWVAPPSAGTGGGDVAGLLLGEDAPVAAAPARFSTSPPMPGDALRVFGYPGIPARGNGTFVDLDYKGEVGGQLIQVESRADQTVKAQPGFSGSPVWSATGSVVGLLHATAFADEPERDAYLVAPRTVAEAWEEQFDYLLVPPNPYRGLEPFTAEHVGVFFGRDAEVSALADRVMSQPVTVVVGPSGVGKSSLVQAGLIPCLQKSQAWAVALTQPKQEPWHRLAIALSRVEGVNATPENVLGVLHTEGFEPTAQWLRADGHPLLVVVDQFEEALTSEPLDTELLDLLLPPPERVSTAARVVLTLRADFLPTLLQHPGLADRLGQPFLVSPMTDNGIREAIQRPADTEDVGFEPGLIDRIVQDAGAGALPLLEFTLTRLWASQRHRTLTFAGYHAMGGVAGALDHVASQQLPELDADVDRVLLRLLRTPADDPKLTTRQRVYKADLPDEQWEILRNLAHVRLVITDTNPELGPYAELAHEALITSWSRLSRLVADNAAFLGWLTDIERRAIQDDLLSEARIAEAHRWFDLRADDIPAKVRTFIAVSEIAIEIQQLELAQARDAAEASQRALRVAESLRLASEARQAIEAEPDTAFLVAWEALLRDGNELSEAVFREALDRLPAPVRILRAPDGATVTTGFIDRRTVFVARDDGNVALLDLDGHPLGEFSVPGHDKLVVAVPPGGGSLLTYRRAVLRRHGAAGELLGELDLPDAPDGHDDRWRGLSLSDQGTCLVHDRDRGWLVHVADEMTVLGTIQFGYESIFRAALSSDGELILAESSYDARLWRISSGSVSKLRGQKGTASACMLADGTIVTGSMDGTGSMWAATGRPLSVFCKGNGLDLFIPAVDADRQHFATTRNTSGIVDVWNAAAVSVASLRAPHAGHVWSAAFSPNGHLLATGNGDGVVRVWNWRTAGEPTELHGHRAAVHEVAFPVDNSAVLLSADHDGAVRLWHLDSPVVPPLLGYHQQILFLGTTCAGWLVSADAVTTMAWSPDGDPVDLNGRLQALSDESDRGQAFALIGHDGACRLWDLTDGSPRLRTQLPWSSDLNLDFGQITIAPDGQHVVRVVNTSAELWSATGELVGQVDGPPPRGVDAGYRNIVGVAFRPDGRRLAVAAKNGAVWIWNTTGDLLSTFVTDNGSPDRTFAIACDPLGQGIATAVRGEVGLWDWDGNRIGRIRPSGYKVFDVTISPDGDRILTISDNPGGQPAFVAELWTRDGGSLQPPMQAAPSVTPVFDRERRYILLPGGGGLSIMDWDGNYLARLAGPRRTALLDNACSLDGDLVAGLFDNGVVRIWSIASRRRIKTLQVGSAQRITFSADGRMLLTGLPTGAIERHPLDVEELFAPAAERATRVLTRDELERFGIDTPLLDMDALQRYRSERPDSLPGIGPSPNR